VFASPRHQSALLFDLFDVHFIEIVTDVKNGNEEKKKT
jgi:hypothetical protein